MEIPLIHIGYPKTASTWLQHNIFWNESSNYFSLASLEEVVEDFGLNDPFGFCPGVIQEKYSKRLAAAHDAGRVPNISFEGLSASHFNISDSVTIANNLKLVFPTARILIVIRNQVDCILSSYKQYVRTGGQGALSFFLSEGANNRIGVFRRQYYLYNNLIVHYASLFGEANILVLPYELFREDQEQFLERIMAFSENDNRQYIERIVRQPPVNSAHNYTVTRITRHLNFFLRPVGSHTQRSLFPSNLLYRHLYLRFLLPRISQYTPKSWEKRVKKQWVQMIEECISDYYCQDNRELVHWVAEDLQKFGYRMQK